MFAHDSRGIELAERHVHGHRQVVAGFAPRGSLFAGPNQHLTADRDDQSVLFEYRDELIGHYKSTNRVLPAEQRLDSDDYAGFNLEYRLVHKQELVAFDGKAKVLLEFDVTLHRPAHLGLEHDVALLSTGFRFIKGNVRIPQQLLCGHSRSRCDAYRGCHGVQGPIVAKSERLSKDLDHALGRGDRAAGSPAGPIRLLRPPGPGHALCEDDEFVTSQAADGVGLAKRRGEPSGDFDQQLVSYTMAQRVVDVLEVVEIYEKCARRHVVAAAAGKHLFHTVDDQGPIGKPGERVVQGLVPQLGGEISLGLFGLLEFGDVDEDCPDTDDLPVRGDGVEALQPEVEPARVLCCLGGHL